MATESFFSSASLALLASAGASKDGKVYSIKPNDGTGDFTFSRGSNLAATRVGADGLIEKGRENLLLQSNNFDTTWVLVNDATLASGQTGYDGSSDAWLAEKSASSNSYLGQNISISGVYTFSLYAKSNTLNGILIQTRGQSTKSFQLNLSTGAIGDTTNDIDSKIEDVGDGWWRISLTGNDSGITQVRIFICEDENNFGTIAGSIYIQDAQLEIGLAATDVISTGATTGKAGLLEDEPRFDYSGGATCPSLLLEPSRTNLVTQSEYFAGWIVQSGTTLTTNTTETLSPEGLYNATKAVGNGTDGVLLSELSTAGGDNVKSVYLKGVSGGESVVLKDPNQTNQTKTCALTTEWQRFDLLDNQPSSFGFWIDDIPASGIYMWGAQLESASYPTSYIPNHSGGSVTRGDDYSESSTSLSIGDSEFSAYYEMEAEVIPREGSTTFFRIEFNGGSDFIGLKGSSNSINNMYTLQTFGSYLETLGNITEAGVVKFLINYSSGTGDLFINGTKYAGVITGPTTGNAIDNVELRGGGYSHDSKQILLFPEALSDADCITLTT